MNIELVKINVDDIEKIWRIQIDAFRGLLDLYQDFDTSPGNETIEKVKMKLLQDYTYYYYIYANKVLVGGIRVIDRKDGSRKRVAPVFIIEKHRNKGIAQKVFYEIEKLHGEKNWELDTIFQEKGNCHLYEKLGYKKIGEIEKINDRMDIVHYIKD